jgi:uncharacterized protein
MMTSRSFSMSKYLHSVPRSDGYAVFHSLFGNLSLLDSAGQDFLQAFSQGATIADAVKTLPAYSPAILDSYANQLIIRGFLIPSGCDEYSIVEENARLRKEHLQSGYLVRALQLVLSKNCNFRCKYCFMDFQQERRNGEDKSAAEMTPDIAETAMRKMLQLLKRNHNDCLNVEFFGGEPLMNWPAIRRVLNTFGNESDGIQIRYSITTNGALITPEIAQMFRQHQVTVTVSVDIPVKVSGLPVIMAKTGERILGPLSILQECGNNVTFNSVISKETIRHVDGRKLMDFALKHEVQMVGLILDLDLAFYRSPENCEHAARILLDTNRYGREIGIPVVGYWHQIFSQIAGQQPINLRSGYKTCPATGCKMSVEPDGSIFTCECAPSGVGYISDIDGVLASEAYAGYAMRAYRHSPACAGCEIEGFCSGVCVGSLENDYDRSDVVEPGACQIFRTVTRNLIENAAASEIYSLRLGQASHDG